MLHTQFQTSKQSGSEEEDSEYFSMYFYGLNISPPGGRRGGHLLRNEMHHKGFVKFISTSINCG